MSKDNNKSSLFSMIFKGEEVRFGGAMRNRIERILPDTAKDIFIAATAVSFITSKDPEWKEMARSTAGKVNRNLSEIVPSLIEDGLQREAVLFTLGIEKLIRTMNGDFSSYVLGMTKFDETLDMIRRSDEDGAVTEMIDERRAIHGKEKR